MHVFFFLWVMGGRNINSWMPFFLCSGVLVPAVWNYGAVERAIRDAAERPGQQIFQPQLSDVFSSASEGYEFYNMYSWERGFGIRYGRCRENKEGRRTKQDIVCACEVRLFLIIYMYMLSQC